MNYYEELGLKPSATRDEIHRAHRRLSKLLHPDQQTDEEVKVLAEAQMRRLNAIVEVLTDPERRRQYDEQLSEDLLPPSALTHQPRWPKAVKVQRFTWRSVPWWVGSTVGAVVLSVAMAWYWADNLGSSFGRDTQVYVRPPQDTSTQAQSSSGASSTPSEIPTPAQSARAKPPQAPRETSAPSKVGQISSRIQQAIVPARSSTQPQPRPSTKPQTTPTPQPVAKQQPAAKQPPPAKPQALAAPQGHPDSKAESTNNTMAKYQAPRAPIEAQEPISGTPAPLPSAAAPPAAEVAPRRFNDRLANAELARPAVRNVDVPPPPRLTSNSGPRNETASVPLPALPNAVAPPKPSEAVASVKTNVPAPPPKPSEPVASAKANVPAPPAKVTYQHPLEGEWIYAPKEPEKRKPGLYPPEFIDLKLVWNEGGLHGQYHARYHVTDKPISPDVSFLISPSDKESRKFVWQGSDGSRGTLRINPVDPQTIRVDWRTTVFGPVAGLTAGTATLVRRSP